MRTSGGVTAHVQSQLCFAGLGQWFPAESLEHYAKGHLGKVGCTVLPETASYYTVLGEPMDEYQEGLHFYFIFSNKAPDFSMGEWLPRIKTEFLSLPYS